MSAPTHPPRRANDYDVQCVLQAFGFESTKHFEDVMAGRRPSALKEPSIWRDKARRAER